MSGVFVDSNVFLKVLEGDHNLKYYFINLCESDVVYRNPVVYSEVVYVWFRLSTGKKSFELKKLPELVKSKSKELKKVEDFLNLAENLSINHKIEKTASGIIKQYGLLPNDALIVATCKHYGIKRIATLDKDFNRIDFLEVLEVG